MINNSYSDRCLTTKVYPYVSVKYNIKKECVEKNIRDAIDIAFSSNRGDYEFREELFGSSLDYNKGKPTNSEFLVTLAIKLLSDYNIEIVD